MDDIKDLIKKRAASLGNEKLDIMTESKLVISTELRVEVRAIGLKNGILKIATEDSVSASEIRLNKNQLIKKINDNLDKPAVKDLVITIR